MMKLPTPAALLALVVVGCASETPAADPPSETPIPPPSVELGPGTHNVPSGEAHLVDGAFSGWEAGAPWAGEWSDIAPADRASEGDAPALRVFADFSLASAPGEPGWLWLLVEWFAPAGPDDAPCPMSVSGTLAGGEVSVEFALNPTAEPDGADEQEGEEPTELGAVALGEGPLSAPADAPTIRHIAEVAFHAPPGEFSLVITGPNPAGACDPVESAPLEGVVAEPSYEQPFGIISIAP
jgi:hypothetical protein